MIGNQAAISSHCHGKLVISTGWLARHEVQFKDATENQERKEDNVSKACLQKAPQLSYRQIYILHIYFSLFYLFTQK